MPGLDHKTPKNVAACVMALREAIRCFGPKVVSPKPILKSLPKLFDHKDKTVRAEASLLAVELFKFLGLGVMQPAMNDLKPVQVKELTEEFEKVDSGKAKPSRFLRSQQKQAATAAAQGID